MKKFTLMLLTLFFTGFLANAQTTIFEDDFESYTAGNYIAQSSSNWTTWNNNPGSAEDGGVSTDFNNTASGANSLKIVPNNDVVYYCGDKTSGAYEIEFYNYVTTGNGGYFNMQHEFGAEWAFSVEFHDGGTGFLHVNNANQDFTYTQDTWVKVKFSIDLDNDQAIFYLDDTEIHTWAFSSSETGGGTPNINLDCVNFYGYPDVTPPYYIDDFKFIEVAAGVGKPEINLSATSFSVTGANATEILNVSNIGDEELSYNIYPIYPASKKETTSPSTNTPKDGTLTHAGDPNGAIGGLASEVTMKAAAKFRPSDVSSYIGQSITSVEIVLSDPPVGGTASLKIWGRGDYITPAAGNLLHSQDFTVSAPGETVTINLDTPFYLDGDEIWVGYECTVAAGGNTVGVDGGPMVSGVNFLATGPAWTEMPAEINANLSITCFLTGTSINQWLTVSPESGTLTNGNNNDITLSFDASALDPNQTYTNQVIVASNTPDNQYVTINVTYTTPDGVNNINSISTSVYPNPSKGILNVEATGTYELNISNITGATIYNGVHKNKATIDLSNHASGVYFLKINTEGKTINEKIIVE